LERIKPKQVSRIIEAVESLSVDPFPSGCRKLRGVEHFYRIKVRDYRVIYQVDIKARIVVIYYVVIEGKLIGEYFTNYWSIVFL